MRLGTLAPVASILLLGVGLSACNGDDDDTGAPDDTSEDTDIEIPDPQLRAVHMGADAALPCDVDGDTDSTNGYLACVELYVGDGTTSLGGGDPFPFGASSGYLELPLTGELTFHLVKFGESNVAANRVGSITVDIAPGDIKTFVVYGANAASNLAISDFDRTLPDVAAGKSRISVFHGAAAAAAASPDFYLDGTAGDAIGADVAFGTYGAATEVDSGNGQFVGIDTDGDGTLNLVGSVNLAGETEYELFVLNVPTTTVPSGFLGMLHTTTSTAPVQVPFGPPPAR